MLHPTEEGGSAIRLNGYDTNTVCGITVGANPCLHCIVVKIIKRQDNVIIETRVSTFRPGSVRLWALCQKTVYYYKLKNQNSNYTMFTDQDPKYTIFINQDPHFLKEIIKKK